MNEQARLTVERHDTFVSIVVKCQHGGVNQNWPLYAGEPPIPELVRESLQAFDYHAAHGWETVNWNPPYDACHCSTAELWARYGDRRPDESEQRL